MSPAVGMGILESSFGFLDAAKEAARIIFHFKMPSCWILKS